MNSGNVLAFAIMMVVVFLFAVLLLLERRSTKRMIKKLNEMLDCAIDGSFAEHTFDESLLSAVENRFSQYLAAGGYLASDQNTNCQYSSLFSPVGGADLTGRKHNLRSRAAGAGGKAELSDFRLGEAVTAGNGYFYLSFVSQCYCATVRGSGEAVHTQSRAKRDPVGHKSYGSLCGI